MSKYPVSATACHDGPQQPIDVEMNTSLFDDEDCGPPHWISLMQL